jgi:hypothetical protein
MRRARNTGSGACRGADLPRNLRSELRGLNTTITTPRPIPYVTRRAFLWKLALYFASYRFCWRYSLEVEATRSHALRTQALPHFNRVALEELACSRAKEPRQLKYQGGAWKGRNRSGKKDS